MINGVEITEEFTWKSVIQQTVAWWNEKLKSIVERCKHTLYGKAGDKQDHTEINITLHEYEYLQTTTDPLDIRIQDGDMKVISTTNLAACVCVSSKFDQFLPARFYFVSKRPEILFA